MRTSAWELFRGLCIRLALAAACFLAAGCSRSPSKVAISTGDPVLDGLIERIVDVRGAEAYRYDARDDAGNRMDTAKIIADPQGGYLAVYHTYNGLFFEVHLALSTDLLNWTHQQSYGSHTHQPTIAETPDGGFLLANETDNGRYNWIQVRYYADRSHLLSNQPARTFDVPHTQVPANQWAEGTPNIYGVTLNPDIDHSTIDIGFHYFMDGIVDRQARGALVDFKTWSADKETELDAALLAFGLQGSLGDRDALTFEGKHINLQEGQLTAGDFGTWKIYLWDWDSQQAYPLEIRTHRGSGAFANPTITRLPAPGGGEALAITLFIPSENSGKGEAGELIYYWVIDRP